MGANIVAPYVRYVGSSAGVTAVMGLSACAAIDQLGRTAAALWRCSRGAKPPAGKGRRRGARDAATIHGLRRAEAASGGAGSGTGLLADRAFLAAVAAAITVLQVVQYGRGELAQLRAGAPSGTDHAGHLNGLLVGMGVFACHRALSASTGGGAES